MRRLRVFSVTSLIICYCILTVYILSTVFLGYDNYTACFLSSSTYCDIQNDLRWSEVGDSPKINRRILKYKLQVNGSYSETEAHIWNLAESTSNISSSPENSQPFKPVIILTYQRCGSSFLGNLFNFDRKAFYTFEPLDSLYSSLYGTYPGWNVPSDIVSYKNGTEREIPFDELTAVSEFLRDLLACDVDSLPTELLAHSFWHIGEHRHANDTAVSIKMATCTRRTRPTVRRASSYLLTWCGKRLSDRDDARHEHCRRLLHDPRLRRDTSSSTVTRSFLKYREMMDATLRRVLNSTCIPLFRSSCAVRPLRVAKVVRASMLSMKPLLEWMPQLRIIHLIRDPRPVALSRRDFHDSARGQFAESTHNLTERTIREAFLYCRQVVADVRLRHRLEKEYPDRVYSLTYEQLVNNPVGRAADIYRFIGERPEQSVFDRFARLAEGKSANESAKFLAARWLDDRVSRLEFDRINEHCSELFHLYPEYLNYRPHTYRTKDVVIASRPPGRRNYPANQRFPPNYKRSFLSDTRRSRWRRNR